MTDLMQDRVVQNNTLLPRSSILPPEMVGVCSISGYRGSGKSFLAAQADLPDNIVYFDFESKGAGIDTQLNFGEYRALTQEAGDDPLALYRATNMAFTSIPPDRFTVAVLDNVSPFELALNAEAANNAETYAQRYGLNLKNVKAGRFGGTRAIVNFMISDLCSGLHSRGVQLIVATSHIRPRWSPGGQIPNKYNVKGADRWQELSILTLILIPGINPPIPDALVQKEQLGIIQIGGNLSEEQISAMQRGEAGHIVSRRLPPKIPECTFQKIRWYLHNPADFNKLKKNERPTVEESDPFDVRLNKEQFAFVRDAVALQERQERDQEEMLVALEQAEKVNKVDDLVKEMSGYNEKMAPVPVQKFLAGKGHECSVPEAGAVIRKLQE